MVPRWTFSVEAPPVLLHTVADSRTTAAAGGTARHPNHAVLVRARTSALRRVQSPPGALTVRPARFPRPQRHCARGPADRSAGDGERLTPFSRAERDVPRTISPSRQPTEQLWASRRGYSAVPFGVCVFRNATSACLNCCAASRLGRWPTPSILSRLGCLRQDTAAGSPTRVPFASDCKIGHVFISRAL